MRGAQPRRLLPARFRARRPEYVLAESLQVWTLRYYWVEAELWFGPARSREFLRQSRVTRLRRARSCSATHARFPARATLLGSPYSSTAPFSPPYPSPARILPLRIPHTH